MKIQDDFKCVHTRKTEQIISLSPISFFRRSVSSFSLSAVCFKFSTIFCLSRQSRSTTHSTQTLYLPTHHNMGSIYRELHVPINTEHLCITFIYSYLLCSRQPSNDPAHSETCTSSPPKKLT